MRTDRFFLVLAALLLAGCAGLSTTTRPPAGDSLVLLERRLSAILDDGEVPAGLAAGDGRLLLDQRYGCRADYAAWIAHCRGYNETLERVNGYRRIPVVARLQDEPLRTPTEADRWVRGLTGGRPGPDAAFDEALALHGALSEMPTRPPRAVRRPFRRADPAAVRREFVSSFAAAAGLLDREALGSVPDGERALLRFTVPWICRTGGRYQPASKNAAPYFMQWIFDPPDPFVPGAGKTERLGIPVPPALFSMTGLYHHLRALSGEPVETTGITKEWNAPVRHPSFAAGPDRAAFGRGLAAVAELLAEARLDSLRAAFAGLPGVAGPSGVSGEVVFTAATRYGTIVVGGSGKNVYRDPTAAVILDLGGDDEYVFTRPAETIGTVPLAAIVDYGGDDVYRTTGVGGPASGILGVSVLIDRAGNDRYLQGVAASFDPRTFPGPWTVPDPESVKTRIVPLRPLFTENGGEGVPLDAGFAFGAGFLGVGILVDEAGDDVYAGQKFAFGAAMWKGVGVLHDVAGDDVYAAGLASLGAGINASFGFLDDRGGNDHYQCLGIHENPYSIGNDWDNGFDGAGIGYGSSWRGEARRTGPENRWPATAAGGLGLVRDAAGDDSYIGSSFGVGAGYAGGVGMVVDDAGNDTYFVKRGPDGANRSGFSGNHALGNGCHRGVGLILDRGGNDRYSASSLGGGTAWDIGTGWLLDLGGDDSMTDLHGKGCAGNTGWGAAKGLAVSFHAGGTDRYERGSFGNAAAIGEGYPGHGGNFSFFIDIGPEEDVYPAKYRNDECRDGGVSTKAEADGVKYPQGIGLFWDGSPLAPVPSPR